jgi:hypothetical protein
MSSEQLAGRYLRLKQELDTAYRQEPWHPARIDRLANDLVLTERELAASGVRLAPPADERH